MLPSSRTLVRVRVRVRARGRVRVRAPLLAHLGLAAMGALFQLEPRLLRG